MKQSTEKFHFCIDELLRKQLDYRDDLFSDSEINPKLKLTEDQRKSLLLFLIYELRYHVGTKRKELFDSNGKYIGYEVYFRQKTIDLETLCNKIFPSVINMNHLKT
jgi:hypothetical protein